MQYTHWWANASKHDWKTVCRSNIYLSSFLVCITKHAEHFHTRGAALFVADKCQLKEDPCARRGLLWGADRILRYHRQPTVHPCTEHCANSWNQFCEWSVKLKDVNNEMSVNGSIEAFKIEATIAKAISKHGRFHWNFNWLLSKLSDYSREDDTMRVHEKSSYWFWKFAPLLPHCWRKLKLGDKIKSKKKLLKALGIVRILIISLKYSGKHRTGDSMDGRASDIHVAWSCFDCLSKYPSRPH